MFIISKEHIEVVNAENIYSIYSSGLGTPQSLFAQQRIQFEQERRWKNAVSNARIFSYRKKDHMKKERGYEGIAYIEKVRVKQFTKGDLLLERKEGNDLVKSRA